MDDLDGARIRRSTTGPARAIIIRVGPQAVRVSPRRDNPRIAQLTLVAGSERYDARFVRHCVDRLTGTAFDEAVTPALGPPERMAFLDSGFVVRESLHLLVHSLLGLGPGRSDTHPLRRVRRRDWPRLATLDRRAFAPQHPFWHLDATGIADARRATPSSRLRVADDGASVLGYAVSGRTGDQGYLQRLAVDPVAQGRGVGTALVRDSLEWLRRRGARVVLVNTPVTNDRALSLYRHLGFTPLPDGLAVLSRSLDGGP